VLPTQTAIQLVSRITALLASVSSDFRGRYLQPPPPWQKPPPARRRYESLLLSLVL